MAIVTGDFLEVKRWWSVHFYILLKSINKVGLRRNFVGVIMGNIDESKKGEIIRAIREGKTLPLQMKEILFPSRTPKEYELIYGCKEREEDILADTMSVPLQKVKTFGQNGQGWTNKLIVGDNLQALKTLLKDNGVKGKVKAVYIDPPFATKRDFVGSREQKAYQDKIDGAAFLEFLRKRLILIKSLLSSDGMIFVHCDWRMGHYIKVLMDEIFSNYEFSEIIWVCGLLGSGKLFPKAHETILCYKSNSAQFNPPMRLGYSERITNALIRDKGGWYYTRGKESSGGSKFLKTYICNDPKLTKEEAIKHANINRPQPAWSVWMGKDELAKEFNDNPVGTYAYTEAENVGYPTQKPEALLSRIIYSSTVKGDIVLDCFSGSGTTLAVAEKMGRRWIGVDSGKLAIYATQQRLLSLKNNIGNTGRSLRPKPFTVYNAGLYDFDAVAKLGKEEYIQFALELFQASPRAIKIGGFEFEGMLYNNPVHVYMGEGKLTEKYVDDLHKFVDSKADRVFIIAPAGKVGPLQDYILKDETRYYFLRIPYSVIDEIHKTSFKRAIQPVSAEDINDPLESVGFDFVIPPEVECDYYQLNDPQKLVKELVIEIKRFDPIQITKKPIDFGDLEALSMVMVDKNYNGESFNMTNYFFSDQIVKEKYKVRIPMDNIGKRIMVIYLDILGNEKREVLTLNNFKIRRKL